MIRNEGTSIVRCAPGVYVLTSSGGRATWSYGTERIRGAHIVWRRIGGHDIFTSP
ncbi:hypothetical protein [Streptomyces sp. NPDC088731]|uniref:hypothetical protein n=1 Tax=Streptomyces sp. NPDC088731 TaxID=3365878 RepID=UPI003811D9EC